MSISTKAQPMMHEESPELPGNKFLGMPIDFLFLAAIVLVVTVLRLPYIFWPHEMNPDESQMLAQGMKYLVDPVPWRAVDGTSGGPLNSYIISFFLLCGAKVGYVLAH